MKKLNIAQMEIVNGGYACISTNPGQGIGLCGPALCFFLSSITPDSLTRFDACPA